MLINTNHHFEFCIYFSLYFNLNIKIHDVLHLNSYIKYTYNSICVPVINHISFHYIYQNIESFSISLKKSPGVLCI